MLPEPLGDTARAMSQENIETVRSYYDAINQRDLDAVFESFAPEIEFHLAGLFPDLEPIYRGPAEVRTFLERFSEPWVDLTVEPAKIIDLDQRVLVFFRFHAKGRDGIEVELPLAHLWSLQNGRAVRMDAYPDERKALEAVGLSEQDADSDVL
jgi:ketosteroid isomerase-like protein